MKVFLTDFDNTHYASNVVQSSGTLRWDAQGNTHNLIIRADFGEKIDISELGESAFDGIPDYALTSGEEFTVGKYVLCFLPRGYINNFAMRVCPAAYAIFCCSYDKEAEELTVYVPNEACLYSCDASLVIDVTIAGVVSKKKLFKRSQDTCFSVNIPEIPGYNDGGIYYTYNNFGYDFPVVGTMLGKPFFVFSPNSQPPQVFSSGSGYKLTAHII